MQTGAHHCDMGVSTGNAVSRGQQERQDAEPYYGEQQEEQENVSAATGVEAR